MLQKVPPQDIEAEQALLCGCLIRPEIVPQIQLTPGNFYRQAHEYIFEAMLSCWRELTVVTLADKLRTAGKLEEIGGTGYLASLMDAAITSAGWKHHAEIIKEKSQRRQLILSCSAGMEKAFSEHEPLAGTLSEIKQDLTNIEREQAPEIESALTVVHQVYKEIERRRENGNKFVGIRTGLENIDTRTSGLEPGSTTYLIARPSIGKSALALTVADWVAANEGPVLFFSLESNRHALTRRRLAAKSGLHLTWIRTGDIRDDKQWGKLHDACSYLSGLPVMIVDHPRYKDPLAIISLSETTHMRQPLKLIVVDHIQLTRPRRSLSSRHQEISQASADLQGLAKSCGCHVLVLCQLSRPDKQSKQKFPVLEAMKESGDLEQNADNVWGLYRENKETELARLEQLKGRDSGTWVAWLKFNRFIQKFYDGQEPNHEPLRPDPEERKDW